MGLKEEKGRVDIVSYVGRTVRLRKEGRYFKGLCPFHSEKTPSFAVDPKGQRFKCFGCGKQGDVLDFIQFLSGKSLPEARAVLENKSIVQALPPPTKPEAAKSKWEISIPCPEPGQVVHRSMGKPSSIWIYRNEQGEGLYCICRFNLPNGKKEFRPLTWRTDGKKSMWQWKGYSRPRPLYGLDKLPKMTKATVMVVEGEKTADAAQRLFPHVAVITWHGGANAVKEHDWKPIAGRRIILFPDYDHSHTESDGTRKAWASQPGNLAMMEIWETLRESCPVVKWCSAPSGLPCGWDWADYEGQAEDALEYIRDNMCDPAQAEARFPLPEKQPPAETEEAEEEAPEVPANPSPPETRNPADSQKDTFPFHALGYDEDDNFRQFYWFFSHMTETIIRYQSTQLGNEHNIKEIAPAEYWESLFPSKTRKLDISSISEMLRRACRETGVFDAGKIRGRGAWIDQGRILIHAGNRLIVDGNPVSLLELKSNFAYQKKAGLDIRLPSPLKSKEANRLIEVCSLFAWDREVSSHLLAGWITLAPFCGALNWRPHMWLIGGAGSGKSWVMENVVRPCLGRLHLAVQSKTTEAAIRQNLQSDAIPVVFDELEAENDTDAGRVQAIIDLARSSSSPDSGSIAKGSVSGKSVKYKVRSMFMFASISQSLTQYSDISRITTLSLKSSSDAEKRRNAGIVKDAITEAFAQGLQSRTIRLLPVILKNIRVFSQAAAEFLGETRLGDQVGTLLAGAYSLYRSDLVSLETAREFIARQDWAEETTKDGSRDEYRLLHAIIEHLTRFDAGRGMAERTIGELIFIAFGMEDDADITKDKAEARLAQIGIAVKDTQDGGVVYFSTASGYIKRSVLRGTPWGANFHKVLSRIDGTMSKPSIRFSSGIVSRAIGIPISLINPPSQAPDDPAGQEEIPF